MSIDDSYPVQRIFADIINDFHLLLELDRFGRTYFLTRWYVCERRSKFMKLSLKVLKLRVRDSYVAFFQLMKDKFYG